MGRKKITKTHLSNLALQMSSHRLVKSIFHVDRAPVEPPVVESSPSRPVPGYLGQRGASLHKPSTPAREDR